MRTLLIIVAILCLTVTQCTAKQAQKSETAKSKDNVTEKPEQKTDSNPTTKDQIPMRNEQIPTMTELLPIMTDQKQKCNKNLPKVNN